MFFILEESQKGSKSQRQRWIPTTKQHFPVRQGSWTYELTALDIVSTKAAQAHNLRKFMQNQNTAIDGGHGQGVPIKAVDIMAGDDCQEWESHFLLGYG